MVLESLAVRNDKNGRRTTTTTTYVRRYASRNSFCLFLREDARSVALSPDFYHLLYYTHSINHLFSDRSDEISESLKRL
jgi:hypothetical protein